MIKNNGAEDPKKILIVDDEPYVLRVLQLKLANAGYSVITAVNGRDGLDKFSREKPAVIISDIRMPLMDGQELYQSIQEQAGAEPFFFIMMTSSIDHAMQLWAEKKGNIHFVEKPLSPRNVIKLVDRCFAGTGELHGTR
jgi:DNA-binding NtrC family response regulator